MFKELFEQLKQVIKDHNEDCFAAKNEHENVWYVWYIDKMDYEAFHANIRHLKNFLKVVKDIVRSRKPFQEYYIPK